MLALDQIKKEYESKCIDNRDLHRLVKFFPEKDLAGFGIILAKDFIGTHEAMAFTEEAVISQMKEDVAFGFEKALDQRGISASLMFVVVKMWCWVLENGLDVGAEKKYTHYGLRLFKEVAVKYGFDNPIGEAVGDEACYASD